MIDLEKVKAICDAATTGPWKISDSYEVEMECCRCGGDYCEDCTDVKSTDEHEVLYVQMIGMHSLAKPNADFISMARTATPELVAEIERLRKMRSAFIRKLKGAVGFGEQYSDDSTMTALALVEVISKRLGERDALVAEVEKLREHVALLDREDDINMDVAKGLEEERDSNGGGCDGN